MFNCKWETDQDEDMIFGTESSGSCKQLSHLSHFSNSFPVDAGRKMNVHKTFRRRPGPLLNVLCTFNLPPVSAGFLFSNYL